MPYAILIIVIDLRKFYRLEGALKDRNYKSKHNYTYIIIK